MAQDRHSFPPRAHPRINGGIEDEDENEDEDEIPAPFAFNHIPLLTTTLKRALLPPSENENDRHNLCPPAASHGTDVHMA